LTLNASTELQIGQKISQHDSKNSAISLQNKKTLL